jgi:hypothetical protein
MSSKAKSVLQDGESLDADLVIEKRLPKIESSENSSSSHWSPAQLDSERKVDKSNSP